MSRGLSQFLRRDRAICFNARQSSCKTGVFLKKWGTEGLNTHSAKVSQLAVVSLPPGEDLPINSQSHGVAATGVNGHLLHHVIAEGSDLAGDGDGPTR